MLTTTIRFGKGATKTQISASRWDESPNLSSRSPILSIKDRYRLDIFRLSFSL